MGVAILSLIRKETECKYCLGVAGVVLCSFGGACFNISNVVFLFKLQSCCLVFVLLVLCYGRPAVHASVFSVPSSR